MNTPTITCKACGASLAHETDRWVDARSGDDGGTYDVCPAARTFEGGHVPSHADHIGRLGSVTEAAHALGVDAADVWLMVASGDLRAERSDPNEAWVIYG